MAELKEPAPKKKSNKLIQLEERHKKLIKDKKSIDECFKTIMPADIFAEYSKIEVGNIDTTILTNLLRPKDPTAISTIKEYLTEEIDCQIISQEAFALQNKQIFELTNASAELNSKCKLLDQEITSKTEELRAFRKKEEQQITNEAKSLLSTLKFGNSESEALQSKYSDLLSSYNQLKIDMQKKMQEARVYKQFRDPMINQSTETTEEKEKQQEDEKKKEMESKTTEEHTQSLAELSSLKVEFNKSKEAAHQMLKDKDREIVSLKNSLNESLNMSHKLEMSNKLNSSNLKAMENDDELCNLKYSLEIHIKNELQLADKIKSLQNPELANIEYIKNIFLKYQLYTKLSEKDKMLMMQNILYDLLKVTKAEKEDINKGKHGLIWKAMQKANPDSLYALISGKSNRPGAYKPPPSSRSAVESFQIERPNI